MKDGIKHFVSDLYNDYRNSRGINAFSKENENRVNAIFEIYGEHINSFEYSKIISSFRRKYVYNKNILVSDHDLKEIVGLMKMYNYIFSNIELKDISVYTILRLHQILYSMVPYPEFGGKVRNQEVCSFGAGMNISSYSNIPADMKKLYIPVKELIIKGKDLATKIGNLVGPAEIREFIDDCVDLNCKLIQIYPFTDGNGRTIRMFTNLIFKIAHIPPVYIENGERKEYYHAMNCAINNGDYSVIHRFYYYKVFDSFYENYLLVRSTNTNTITTNTNTNANTNANTTTNTNTNTNPNATTNTNTNPNATTNTNTNPNANINPNPNATTNTNTNTNTNTITTNTNKTLIK